MRWVHEDDHVLWLAPVAGFLASQAPDPEPLLAGFGPSLRRSPTWVAAAAAEHVAGFAQLTDPRSAEVASGGQAARSFPGEWHSVGTPERRLSQQGGAVGKEQQELWGALGSLSEADPKWSRLRGLRIHT